MYDSILVPTDGRPGTNRAVNRALNLAQKVDAAVHVLYVIDLQPELSALEGETHEAVRGQFLERGQNATDEVEALARDLGLDVSHEVREGTPSEAILEYVSEHDIDLVVMGNRSQTDPGRRHLGSTTQRVLVRADVPVLAVPVTEAGRPVQEADTYTRIVIPTDGSDAAERAAEHGLALAEQYGADVRVIYVVDVTTYGFEDTPRSIVGLLKEGGNSTVETIATDARDRGLSASTSVLRGIPEDAILQYADGARADLVVMGTRGQSGVGERFLGSTTERVLRRTGTPVLTVD